MNKTFKLYTDGAFFKRELDLGIGGYLLDSDGKEVFEFSEIFENFQPKSNISVSHPHEILAMEKGLQIALQHDVRHIECYSDDLGLCQIASLENSFEHYIEKNIHLKKIFDLKSKFDSITFQYIPRRENKKADKLSRKHVDIKHESIDFKALEDAFYVDDKYYTTSKNKELKADISEKRKNCDIFYVLEFYFLKDNSYPCIDIYKIQKSPEISKEILLSLESSSSWMSNCINALSQIIELEKSSHFAIFTHGKGSPMLDDILLQRKPVIKKTKLAFLNLQKAIERKDYVCYYKDAQLVSELFEPPSNNSSQEVFCSKKIKI